MDESTARSRDPDSMRQAVLWALLPTLALLLIAPAVGDAQVTTSITSTTGTGDLGTTVTQAGNLYNITGGTRPGNGPNLFHSFGDFSVGAGDIGNFLNTPVNGSLPVTSNILSRVTGGNISNIYGTIQTTDFGSANLFLVNPSGIVLGPHGSVNVGGSVSFTTAQYLRLFDEVNSANFYVDPANDGLANSVLAVAPVVDFGFLSPAAYGFLTPPDPSATITVQGSALSVPSGQSISLVGGKVVIQGDTLQDGTVQPAHLSAPNGSIQLASTASPGEFDVATLGARSNVNLTSFTSFGSVSLAPGSSIDVSGPRTVFVKGGQLVLSINDATLSTSESSAPGDTVLLSPGSSIVTSNSGTEPGADVQITVGNLNLDGSAITTQTSGDGNGGNIKTDVGVLSLTNAATINSYSLFGRGQGGNVTVQGLQGPGSAADSVTLTNGARIDSRTFFDAGRAGAITITTQTLALANGTNIKTDTFGAGPAGDITLNVDMLTVSNPFDSSSFGLFGIFSNSNSTDPTAGNAGSITIQGINGPGSSATSMSLDFGTISTEISGGTSTTTPADISITAHTLVLANFAQIRADTSGAASAGNITLNVDTLTIKDSPRFGFPGITSNSTSTDSTAGNTGNITIQGVNGPGSSAMSVSLDNSEISTTINGGSAANTPAGLSITAHALALDNSSSIGAGSGTQAFGAAPAGNISLNVDTLTAANSSEIGSSSFPVFNLAAGNAGTITIQGVNGPGSSAMSVSLDHSAIGTEMFGGTAASTPATITITAHTLALANLATIGADTLFAAPAGNITLNVGTLTVGSFSGIATRSSEIAFRDPQAGNAGTITIQGITGSGSPAANVSLDGGVITTETFGGSAATEPGAITITAHTLALAGNAQIKADTHGAASAGDITLNVDTLTAGESIISSSSTFTGRSGSPIQPDTSGAVPAEDGNAGHITIQGITGAGSPAANVSLDNVTISTTIDGGSSSTTPATIDITAQTVNLANGAQIKADTSGAAPAGNIALNVDTLTAGILTEISSTSIPTDSTAGNAGGITIQGITGPGSSATNVSLKGNTSFGNEFCCKVIITTIAGGTSSTTPATIDITAQTVNLANGAQISAETDGAAPAGDITLNVGTLTAGNFSVISSGSGHRGDPAAGSAGNITIQGINGFGSPAANVSLLDFSEIRSETFGGSAANTAANIDITAQTLALAHGVIRADAEGTAPAGNITFNVSKLTVDSSSISSSSFLFDFVSLDSAAGNAGTITIQGINGSGSSAANVSLLDFTGINTLTVGGSTANTPATITITAQKLTLANAVIAADTFGAAPAGNIALNVGTLTAGNFSVIESGSSHFELSLDPTVGKAGNITIQGITGSPAGNVSLDGTTISTRTTGSANTAANIDITAQTLALTNFATIEADTFGAAPAGNITLNVGTLTASDSLGGFILKGIISNSLVNETLEGTPAGNAGNITIQGVTGSGSSAANVRLDNSNISTRIFSGSAANTPANIVIAAQAVTLSNGADITASTSGNAPAGNIKVVTQQLTMTPDSTITSNALDEGVATTGKAGSITITGAGSAPTTIAGGSIQAQSETSASAGDITFHAPGDLSLLGTTVSVKNTGAGNAGSIDLRAGNDLLMNNSQVSTESAQASGGNIKLTAPNLIHLVDSTLTSSVQGQAGSNGGNINIDPQWVVIQNSQLLANANAGAGGNITITATGAVLIDPSSRIDASAGPAGISGSVNINSPIQVLGGILVPLSQSFSQASLSGDRCAADPTGQFSSFVQTGRDGVPQVPGALSPSPLSFLETLTSGSLGSQSPNWAAVRLGLDSLSFDDSTRFHSACRS